VAPIRGGRRAMIAAGAVLVNDAKPYGLYMGTPARQVGWVGPAGVRLLEIGEGAFRCPRTNQDFLLNDEGFLSERP